VLNDHGDGDQGDDRAFGRRSRPVAARAFGAGTLPSMLSASFLFGRLGVRTRGWLLRGAALFVIVLGLTTIWQGIRYDLVMQRLLG
jgi:sulfite exporter TauE/SafE